MSYAKVPPEGALELQFWLLILEQYNGQSIWHSPSAVWLVYSDANDTGYGGYIIDYVSQIAHGQWSPEEAAQNSTRRSGNYVLECSRVCSLQVVSVLTTKM